MRSGAKESSECDVNPSRRQEASQPSSPDNSRLAQTKAPPSELNWCLSEDWPVVCTLEQVKKCHGKQRNFWYSAYRVSRASSPCVYEARPPQMMQACSSDASLVWVCGWMIRLGPAGRQHYPPDGCRICNLREPSEHLNPSPCSCHARRRILRSKLCGGGCAHVQASTLRHWISSIGPGIVNPWTWRQGPIGADK